MNVEANCSSHLTPYPNPLSAYVMPTPKVHDRPNANRMVSRMPD